MDDELDFVTDLQFLGGLVLIAIFTAVTWMIF
ncbi:hypothetical protein EC915_10395 [Pseudomonas sp. LP_7_YM]|nr:hypothetical protein EC915_10395 [Pseudomonas sp. LP_7_YM]